MSEVGFLVLFNMSIIDYYILKLQSRQVGLTFVSFLQLLRGFYQKAISSSVLHENRVCGIKLHMTDISQLIHFPFKFHGTP